MATSGIVVLPKAFCAACTDCSQGALIAGVPRTAPPTRSKPRVRSTTHIYADWKDTEMYDNMHPDRVREVLSEPKKKQAGPAPRTTNEEPVMKEETPDRKRKHDEINIMQANHRQAVVDTARAVDMDELHFNAPFSGLNFAANLDSTRFGPYHYDAFHPPNHPAHGGRAFFDEPSIYSNSVPESPNFVQSLSGDTLLPESFYPSSYGTAQSIQQDGAEAFFPGSFGAGEPLYTNGVDTFSSSPYGHAEPSHVGSIETFVPGHLGAKPAVDSHENHVHDGHEMDFKREDAQESYSVSATPAEDSDFAASESEDERPRKTPKLNKDGGPRKPRQPRPKLLKWTDDDWKNVCLGIVWACGEIGVQIPFEQAAQVVGEKCTAGALQQALLKLRGKQVDAGHSIPNLKMAWTRKNKLGTPGKTNFSVEPEANKTPRKKPTRFEATQSLIVTLPRAYTNKDREGLQAPYKWKKPPRKVKSANIQNEQFPYEAEYLPATPTGHQFYHSPPETPYGNNTGYLQGMVLGGGEYTNLLTTEGLHEVGMGWGDAADDVFGIE